MKMRKLKNATTILVQRSTRERLQKHGGKTETYDEIIIRLLDSFEQEKGGVESAE